MKKITTFLVALSFSIVWVCAQTITSADFGSVGDSVFLGFDETPGVSVGPAGTGQTWNFTSLNTETLDTLFFLNPAFLPNGSSFPSANLALASGEGLFFLEKTTSVVLNHGFSFMFGPVVSDVNYNPPVTYLQFPASIGTTYNTNSSFVAKSFLGVDTNLFSCHIVIDSAMVRRQLSLSVIFDASGTLQLPTENYGSALRAYSEEITRDSVFVFAPNHIFCPPFLDIPPGWSLAPDFLVQLIDPDLAGVILDTNRVYTWYAPGAKFSTCAIDVDYDGSVISARFISDTSQVGLWLGEALLEDVKLYPNPAATGFMVQSEELLSHHVLQLMDMHGRIVKVQLMNDNQPVDVQALDNGIYLVQILNETGRVIHRNKVVVQK